MLCFVFSALVVALDQLFKRYITITMTLYEQKTLIPGLVGITYVQNPNAALSIYIGGRWVLAAIMFVCVIILIAILLRYNEGFWGTLGLAAVLGGAVGNFIDRVFIGEVVDMFEFLFVNFAIFNIADIFVLLGGLTFCIFFIVSSIKSSGGRGDTQAGELAGSHSGPASSHIDVTYSDDYDYEDEENDYNDVDYDGAEYDDTEYMGAAYDPAVESNDDESDDVLPTRPKPYLRPMTPVDPESIRKTRHVLSPFEIDTSAIERADDDIAFSLSGPAPDTIKDGTSPQSGDSGAIPAIPAQASESQLLGELELLESDFTETYDYEDDDVDELLREYGFEDEDAR